MQETSSETPSEAAWKSARGRRERTRHWLEEHAVGKSADDSEHLLAAARLLSEPTLGEWHLSEEAMHEAMRRSIEALTDEEIEASHAAYREGESDLLKEYRKQVAELHARIDASLSAVADGLPPEQQLYREVWRSAQWLQFTLDHGTTPGDNPLYRPLDALQNVGLDALEAALETMVNQQGSVSSSSRHGELVHVAFGLVLAWRNIAESGMPLAWRSMYAEMARAATLQTQNRW